MYIDKGVFFPSEIQRSLNEGSGLSTVFWEKNGEGLGWETTISNKANGYSALQETVSCSPL